MFSKNNTEANLSMDTHGAIFFDYNPVHFNYLLDQLRAIKRLPKSPDYQLRFQAPYINSPLNFTHMLIDFGLAGMTKISFIYILVIYITVINLA